MTQILVSVVLPFHRVDAYLFQAVQSVLDSEYENFEVILVADGQAKESVKISPLNLESDKVRVITNSGSGLVDALNTGIETAQGSLIARMDSDDLMHPQRLKVQSQFLESNSEVSVVGSQVTYICRHGTRLGSSRYPNVLGIKNGHKPALPHVAHPATMFRKAQILQVGGYRKNFPNVEDLDLWNRLLNLGRTENLEAEYLSYRIHPDQVSLKNAVSQRFQALRADVFDILGSVPPLLNHFESERLGPRYIADARGCLKGKDGRTRRRLKSVLGFFAVRLATEEFARAGGMARLPQNLRVATRRQMFLFKIALFHLPELVKYLKLISIESKSQPTIIASNCGFCSEGKN